MSDVFTQNDQQRKKLEDELVLLFASEAAAAGLAFSIAVLLRVAFPKLTESILNALAQLVARPIGPDVDQYRPPDGAGPQLGGQEDDAAAWRASFVLHAADRLEDSDDQDKDFRNEQRWFQLHLAAQDRRLRIGAAIDAITPLVAEDVPELPGVLLLGWRSVMDQNTTPECADANGKNFKAMEMPDIGLPGTVHPRCRCAAGPPIPGAPLLPST